MSEQLNKPFYIDPEREREITYFQLVADLGLEPQDGWFAALGGATRCVRKKPVQVDKDSRETLVSGLAPTGADSDAFYRVFLDLTRAFIHDCELDLGVAVASQAMQGSDHSSPTKRTVVDSDTVRLEQLLKGSEAKIGIHTSGTTGRPKQIWHQMNTLCRGVRAGMQHERDVWGFAYEPKHFAGIQVFLQALANRNTIVRLFGLEPVAARQAIERYGVTHMSSTPTFAKMLCSDDAQFERVRRITLGGERIDAITEAAVRKAFPNASLRNVYASTELGSILTARGDVFTVGAGFEGKVVVRDGQLCVASELLASSIVTDEAFFETGDLVEVVEEKPLQFRFVGRVGDWINVGGEKVNPHRVEEQLTQIPQILSARVFAIPNSVIGNLVACEVVLRDGEQLSASDVQGQLKDILTRYEMPQVIQFVANLSLTTSGKKQR